MNNMRKIEAPTVWTKEFLTELYENNTESIYRDFEREIELNEFIIIMNFFNDINRKVITTVQLQTNHKEVLKQLEKEYIQNIKNK